MQPRSLHVRLSHMLDFLWREQWCEAHVEFMFLRILGGLLRIIWGLLHQTSSSTALHDPCVLPIPPLLSSCPWTSVNTSFDVFADAIHLFRTLSGGCAGGGVGGTAGRDWPKAGLGDFLSTSPSSFSTLWFWDPSIVPPSGLRISSMGSSPLTLFSASMLFWASSISLTPCSSSLLSCLAVRYGGQRSVLTKPFWVQIAISVFHQDPKEQNASFKIIAMFTEVAEFHQVFTRFSPGFHQVSENPWGRENCPNFT